MIGFDLIPSFWDDGEIREGGRVTYTCLKPEGRSEGERRKYAAPKALPANVLFCERLNEPPMLYNTIIYQKRSWQAAH